MKLLVYLCCREWQTSSTSFATTQVKAKPILFRKQSTHNAIQWQDLYWYTFQCKDNLIQKTDWCLVLGWLISKLQVELKAGNELVLRAWSKAVLEPALTSFQGYLQKNPGYRPVQPSEEEIGETADPRSDQARKHQPWKLVQHSSQLSASFDVSFLATLLFCTLSCPRLSMMVRLFIRMALRSIVAAFLSLNDVIKQ